jgi:hypothetical protein
MEEDDYDDDDSGAGQAEPNRVSQNTILQCETAFVQYHCHRVTTQLQLINIIIIIISLEKEYLTWVGARLDHT